MKSTFRLFLLSFACILAFGLNAQRVNPTTQIKKAPGNAAGRILKTNSNGELDFVLDATTLTSNTSPSGAPPAGSSGIHLNTSTGQVSSWNGSTWAVVGVTNLTYTSSATTGTVNSDTGADATIPAATTSIAGLMTAADKTQLNAVQSSINAGGFSSNGVLGKGLTGDRYRLGGYFNQNTTISGVQGTYSFTLDSTLQTTIRAAKATGPSVTSNALVRSGTAFPGIFLNTFNSADVSRISYLSLDDDAPFGLFYNDQGSSVAKFGFLITPDLTGDDTDLNIKTRNVASGAATTGQVLTLVDAATGKVEYTTVSGGGGSSISTYSAGNGAIVTASGAGITFARTTASVWTFNVPAGVELLSFDINSTAGQSATAALDIDFVFAGSRPYNQDASVDMTDAKVPVITTLKKITPATYPSTSAANNAAWTADVTSAGTLRISTTEFAEVSSSGANATGIKGNF